MPTLRLYAATISMLCMLCACTGYHPPRFDPATCVYRWESPYLELCWERNTAGGSTAVTGFMRNRGPYRIQRLELEAVVGDRTRARFDLFPEELRPSETKTFRIVMSDALSQPVKLRYRFESYGDMDAPGLEFGLIEEPVRR